MCTHSIHSLSFLFAKFHKCFRIAALFQQWTLYTLSPPATLGQLKCSSMNMECHLQIWLWEPKIWNPLDKILFLHLLKAIQVSNDLDTMVDRSLLLHFKFWFSLLGFCPDFLIIFEFYFFFKISRKHYHNFFYFSWEKIIILFHIWLFFP